MSGDNMAKNLEAAAFRAQLAQMPYRARLAYAVAAFVGHGRRYGRAEAARSLSVARTTIDNLLNPHGPDPKSETVFALERWLGPQFSALIHAGDLVIFRRAELEGAADEARAAATVLSLDKKKRSA